MATKWTGPVALGMVMQDDGVAGVVCPRGHPIDLDLLGALQSTAQQIPRRPAEIGTDLVERILATLATRHPTAPVETLRWTAKWRLLMDQPLEVRQEAAQDVGILTPKEFALSLERTKALYVRNPSPEGSSSQHERAFATDENRPPIRKPAKRPVARSLSLGAPNSSFRRAVYPSPLFNGYPLSLPKLHPFLETVERQLEESGVPGELWTPYVAQRFRGLALEWFKRLNPLPPLYPDFRRQLVEYFSPTMDASSAAKGLATIARREGESLPALCSRIYYLAAAATPSESPSARLEFVKRRLLELIAATPQELARFKGEWHRPLGRIIAVAEDILVRRCLQPPALANGPGDSIPQPAGTRDPLLSTQSPPSGFLDEFTGIDVLPLDPPGPSAELLNGDPWLPSTVPS